jgi:DNA polymerase III epsilon subunit-like protein
MTKVIIFDTETTGLPKKRNQNALHEPNCWPDIVSVSWSVFSNGEKKSQRTFLIKPENWTIPVESSQIHGITHEHAINFGVSLRSVMDEFKAELSCDAGTPVRVVSHNIAFDKNVMFNAWKWRLNEDPDDIWKCDETCTMLKSEGELKLRHPNVRRFKWPSLAELWTDTFKTNPPVHAHSADRDVSVLEQICMARWKGSMFMGTHDLDEHMQSCGLVDLAQSTL